MIRRPPRSTRTDTLFPYTTLFRSFEKRAFVPKRVGPNLPTRAPNSLYPSADGAWVLIAANSNIIFSRLAQVMGQPELLADPRFATIRARGERHNMAALDALISDWTRQHDAESLERLLIAESIPASRLYTIADIYDDPHYAERGMLVRVPHATLGHTPQAGLVPKLSRTPGHIRPTRPALGPAPRAVPPQQHGTGTCREQ